MAANERMRKLNMQDDDDPKNLPNNINILTLWGDIEYANVLKEKGLPSLDGCDTSYYRIYPYRAIPCGSTQGWTRAVSKFA